MAGSCPSVSGAWWQWFSAGLQEITPIEKSEEVTAAAIQAASDPEKLKTKEKNSQLITCRIAVSSYSNFSNVANNSHRLRYTVIANAGQTGHTKLAAESYISFTHKINEWEKVQANLNSALKIYTLAVRYNFGEKASLWAGRKINPAIANVGAVDGLQFEYRFGKIYTGVVTGFRPDYTDYSFNSSLFEYAFMPGKLSILQTGVCNRHWLFLNNVIKEIQTEGLCIFNTAIRQLKI